MMVSDRSESKEMTFQSDRKGEDNLCYLRSTEQVGITVELQTGHSPCMVCQLPYRAVALHVEYPDALIHPSTGQIPTGGRTCYGLQRPSARMEAVAHTQLQSNIFLVLSDTEPK